MGNFITDLFKGGAEGVLTGAGKAAKDLRIAITGVDPEKKAELESKIAEFENAVTLANLDFEKTILQAQAQINLEDAKSDKWWQAGWRPFIGWMGGAGLFIQYFVYPITALFGVDIPQYNFTELLNLLLAILGVGIMRSYDKKTAC
jgi:hypothetical protein